MDLSQFAVWLFAIFGFNLLLFLVFFVLILWVAIKMVNKHPFIALFILLVIMVLATVGLSNPVTFVVSLGALITAVTALIYKWKKLIKAVKK